MAAASSSSAAAGPVSGAAACRSGLHTLDFVDAMRGAGNMLERVQATCKLLEEDGKRAESLLDMSLCVDGDEVSRASESVARTKQRELWC